VTVTGVIEVFAGGVWVDVSDRVDDVEAEVLAHCGRSSIFQDPDPSQMTLVINNDDGRFTAGNPDSDLAPDFDLGCPIRWTEVVDATTVHNFNGFVQDIRATITFSVIDPADPGGPPDTHATAAVSCVDTLQLLDNSGPMLSVLGEHIKAHGGTALVAYWPLTEAAAPFAPAVGSGMPSLTPTVQKAAVTPESGTPLATPQGAPPVIADESPTLLLEGASGTFTGLVTSSDSMILTGSMSIAVPATKLVTIVGWFYSDPPAAPGDNMMNFTCSRATVGVGELFSAGTLQGHSSAISGPFDTISPTTSPLHQGWTPIAVRFGWDTGVLELWVGRDVYTGSFTGTAGSSNTITGIQLGGLYHGGIGDIQIYVGAAGDWDHGDFIDQYVVAQLAHDRQPVADRIAMIGDYAQIDPSIMDIEASPTVMSHAEFAGKSYGAALREAVTADQGIVFGAPDGKVTFQSRTHRYYGPDTPVAVPYAWIGSPLNVSRDGRVNRAVVVQPNGTSAVSEDRTSMARYGQQLFAAQPADAVATNARALANTTRTLHTDPRSRLNQMVFSLDGLDEPDQLTLLTLAIGDRITITDPPSDWPPEVAVASIEGRTIEQSNGKRTLTLTAAPVLGVTPGTPGPWFVIGSSLIGGGDLVAY
jgi:hypothetical protein